MAINPDTIPFLQPGQPWPPAGELGEERLQRYSRNKALFKGEHWRVYDDTIKLLRDDVRATLELAINFPGAVSKLFSDLLFGETPRYVSSTAQEWVDDFIEANGLHRANYRAALAQSYRGEAVYKLRLTEGRERAVAEVIPASIWFPVVDPDNVTDIQGHVLAWVKSKPDRKGNQVRYLRAEIHLPGSIHQRLWRLSEDNIIQERADLGTFYSPPPPEEQETGVEEPLIVVVPNLEVDDSPFGLDDYSEADTLFHQLDLRLAQIAKVLDRHTDPNMYGPVSALEQDPATGEWVVRAGRYFPVAENEPPPGYLVWDAKLDANFRFIEHIMRGLYIATDTNAAAFSLLESGSVPSGAALKRLLIRPLARTNRKRLYFDVALRQLFALAARLERANGRRDVPDDLNLHIEWKDGLPEDPREAAEIEQIRTGGKATSSVRSAIRRLDGGSEESIENELAEIAAEEARGEMPAVTLTTFGFGQTEE